MFVRARRVLALSAFAFLAVIATHAGTTEVVSEMKVRSVRHPVLHTTDELIDEAEAAKHIDHETALLYKVFALMGDCRLPEEFIGDAPPPPDNDVLLQVRSELGSLSPATQETLKPFLMRPDEPGSWVELPSNCANRSATSLDDGRALEWVTLLSANGKATIHFHAPDAVLAGTLGAEVSLMWNKLTGVFGGREPRPDTDSGRYDIYISYWQFALTKHAFQYGFLDGKVCSDSGTLIVLNQALPFESLKHELAFLLTEAIVRTYGMPLGSCSEYSWLRHATAMWGVHYIYPVSFPVYRRSVFGADPAAIFILSPAAPLNYTGHYRDFGAYLFPFFLQHQLGDLGLIRGFWENASDPDSLRTIDSVLASSGWGGLASVWPQFVRYNWNQAPVDDYRRVDSSLTFSPPTEPNPQSDSDGMSTETVAPPAGPLGYLSAQYYTFDVKGPSVLFLNGWTFEADKNFINVDMSPLVYTSVPRAAKNPGIRVEALAKVNGNWEKHVGSHDWTDKGYVSWCGDFASERVTQIVVIVSNSEFRDRTSKFQPDIDKLPFVVYSSNIACAEWRGSTNADENGPYAVDSAATNGVVFKRASPSPAVLPFNNGSAIPGFVYQAEGTVNWTIRPSADCSVNPSSGTFDAAGDGKSLAIYTFAPRGSSGYRAYVGFGGTVVQHFFTPVCHGVAEKPELLIPWLFTVDYNTGQFFRLSGDGKTMADGFGDDVATYRWDLRATAPE